MSEKPQTLVMTLFGEVYVPEKSSKAGSKKRAAQPESNVEEDQDIAQEPTEKPKPRSPVKGRRKKASAKPDFSAVIARDEKKYYTIGEVATLLDVRISNIRYWTAEFSMKVKTNRKGDRYYTPQQLEELKMIQYLLKQKKFKLAGAKEKLKEMRSQVHPQSKENLEEIKEKLLSLKSKLEQIRNQIP